MNKDAYYSHLMPQTAFRDTIKQGKAIQLTLVKLKVKDSKIKQQLREKINEEDDSILNVLLPEDLVEVAKNDGHLEQIFHELGI